MKELSLDEILLTSGGHSHEGPCDGHDHHDQTEQHAPKPYHFDFSDWF